MAKTGFGICKLTEARGRFVKSHIIPKALTPREKPGGLMFQSDGLERPKNGVTVGMISNWLLEKARISLRV